jgi:hypothetical protein
MIAAKRRIIPARFINFSLRGCAANGPPAIRPQVYSGLYTRTKA